MGFYRKNIGGGQQLLRLALGIAGTWAGFAFAASPLSWLIAASSVGFAATGLVGYCPFCHIAGIGRKGQE